MDGKKRDKVQTFSYTFIFDFEVKFSYLPLCSPNWITVSLLTLSSINLPYVMSPTKSKIPEIDIG